jgi:hypothetical protein
MNQKELYEAWEERVAQEMKIYVNHKVISSLLYQVASRYYHLINMSTCRHARIDRHRQINNALPTCRAIMCGLYLQPTKKTVPSNHPVRKLM